MFECVRLKNERLWRVRQFGFGVVREIIIKRRGRLGEPRRISIGRADRKQTGNPESYFYLFFSAAFVDFAFFSWSRHRTPVSLSRESIILF